MGTSVDTGDGGLSPDEAFSVLGNETRVQILQALGEADGTVPFTNLRERVGIRQGGNFNYHLDQLLGHFVGKTADGYVLRQPGRRVVQAVLSGAVTADTSFEYTQIDEACWVCEAPMVVGYDQEHLDMYCTECDGFYRDQTTRWPMAMSPDESAAPTDLGYLGTMSLPPAGIAEQSPADAYRAAMTWGILDSLAISNDVCPRCSGPVEKTARVCDHHDTGDSLCEQCGNKQAIHVQVRCRNCIYQHQGIISHVLLGKREYLEFVTANGVSPFPHGSDIHPYKATNPTEEILSAEPLKARISYTIKETRLTLTVDDEFSIVDSSTS